MGNTPSNQYGSPRHPQQDSRSGGRNPNLRVPIPPPNPNNISPSHSNPASPSGRSGSPRRRKSLELPDMNKLSFTPTPTAAIPTTATNTSHHLAPSTARASGSTSAGGSTSSPPHKRWPLNMGGTKSPLSPGFGQMSKVDPSIVKPTPATATVPTPKPPAVTQPSPAPIEEIDDGSVSVQIHWTANGRVIQLAANFADNWKGRIPMTKSEQGYTATINLRPGSYRIKFIVDDSWRCAKDMPTAVDDDGTLVNTIEVEAPQTEEEARTAWEMDEPLARPQDDEDLEWTKEIPASIYLYQYIEELPHMFDDEQSYRAHLQQGYITPVPAPPVLPRILEKVIVNSDTHYDNRLDQISPAGLDDNSILAVPNHVVLNHLTASAIKNGTLGVGTTTRYRKKYITTMFFKPTPADLRGDQPEVPTQTS